MINTSEVLITALIRAVTLTLTRHISGLQLRLSNDLIRDGLSRTDALKSDPNQTFMPRLAFRRFQETVQTRKERKRQRISGTSRRLAEICKLYRLQFFD